MDIPSFRAMFPAFADATAYPDALIQLWSDAADEYIAGSWVLSGTTLTLAHNLLTAHLLARTASMSSSSTGEAQAAGPVVSASQGSVSASFSAPPTKTGWQHWLSSTPYGMELWALLSMRKSSAGVYIGGLPERTAYRKVGGVFS